MIVGRALENDIATLNPRPSHQQVIYVEVLRAEVSGLVKPSKLPKLRAGTSSVQPCAYPTCDVADVWEALNDFMDFLSKGEVRMRYM